MLRKLTAALLCIVLLASCQPETGLSSGDVTLGRYMEESMPLPDLFDIISLEEVSTDKFYLLGSDFDYKLRAWHSADGCESWEEIHPAWLEAASEIILECVAFAPDGTCYLSEHKRLDDRNYQFRLYRGDDSGLHPVNTAGDTAIHTLAVLDNGDLLLSDGEGFQRLNLSDGAPQFYPVGGGIGHYRSAASYDYFDETLIVLEEDDAFVVYDLESNSESASFPCPSDGSGQRVICLQPDRSAVVYCDQSGIYRQTLDGVLVEQVVDGRLTSFNMPSLLIESIHMRQDGAFLVLCQKFDGGYSLLKYRFDPTAPTTPSTQLTIYSMRDNFNVRLAATVFMKQHPDVLVDLQVGIGDDDTVILTDAIRTLNTQLLAGAGPDILILDELPMDSYIEKGVLADLSGDIDTLLASGALYDKVAGAYQSGDGVYVIPASFHVPVIAGADTPDIQSLDDIVSYLEHLDDPRVYVPGTSLDWFYEKLSHRWFAPDGTFRPQPFETDLSAIARYAAFQSETTECAPDLLNQSVWYAGSGLSILFGNLTSVDDASVILSAVEARGGGLYSLGGAFIPQSMYGVNAAGAQTDLAKEFVLEALEEESQSVSIHSGIPVNKNAVAALIGRKESGKKTYLFRQENNATQEQYSLEVSWFNGQTAESFQALLEQVEYPAPNNAITRQIVLDETAAYLIGTASLEDTLRNVEQKLAQYSME